MTLVEVILAVVFLTVGLLGLLGTAAAVTGMIAEGRRLQRTSALAHERLEILHSRSCGGITNGRDTREGYAVAWTVSGAGRAKRVVLTVTSSGREGARDHVFQALIPCEP